MGAGCCGVHLLPRAPRQATPALCHRVPVRDGGTGLDGVSSKLGRGWRGGRGGFGVSSECGRVQGWVGASSEPGRGWEWVQG